MPEIINMKVVTKMNGCCRYTTQPFFWGFFQLEELWFMEVQGFSKHSVCLSELGGVCSHPELTSGNFFLCSCLIHTLSLFQKTQLLLLETSHTLDGFHIFCTCIWCLFNQNTLASWFWCLEISVLHYSHKNDLRLWTFYNIGSLIITI